MITETQEKTWFKYLVDTLKDVLDGDLGRYQLAANPATEIPSIYVKSKELNPNQWKFKEGSGIECIVHRSIGMKREPIMGANILNFTFPIELVQHNLGKTLTIPVIKIVQEKRFIIYKDPIVTPQQEIPAGFAFGRAIIDIEVSQRMEFS
jgi:hypothetical protein